MFFPVLLAKILSAGAVAQAATGAGIVLVAVTGAGAAGVLPGPVQDTFTSIVSDETTQEPPVDETPVDEAPVDETPIEEVPVEEAPVAETPAEDAELTQDEWLDGPAEGQPFGEWVSYGAQHGWATGQAVSSAAHERNDDRKGRGDDDGEEVETPEAEPTTGTDDGAEVEDEDAPEVGQSSDDDDSRDRGDGGDRGHGNGRD